MFNFKVQLVDPSMQMQMQIKLTLIEFVLAMSIYIVGFIFGSFIFYSIKKIFSMIDTFLEGKQSF